MEEKVLSTSTRTVIARIFAVAMMGAVTACQPVNLKNDTVGNSIPSDAIPVGKDQYMVPIGNDGTKCQMYRMYSPSHAVVAAIFFKTASGSFVIDRAKADCK